MNLKELSSILGLSQTTVSRALNGYPEVSAATRERVELAALKHSYTPNIRAKSLATGQAMAIGHVIPMATKHEMVNPVFADFIAGAATAYTRHGYEMVLTIVEDGNESNVYRNLKARAAVDGVILHAPSMNDSRINFLNEIGLPFAVHGRASGQTEPYCWLDVNNRSAFRRATDFLLDLGHRRIALINGNEAMDFAYRRRHGFTEAMAARKIPVVPEFMYSEEMTEEYGYRAASKMLKAEDAPTAFLVSSIISAIGVRRAVEEAGLIMGRDVSVITHDDALSYLPNGDEIPIFTATRSSVREAGRRLAEMLIARINDPSAAPEQVLLEAELRVGRSTGPAPVRAFAED